MNRDHNIEQIRAACIKTNPEIIYLRAGCITLEDGSHHRPIRLADVLLAMQELTEDNWHRHYVVNRFGQFLNDNDPSVPGLTSVATTWNLRKDDLTEQSDETIKFIAELLK